jgi:hypothetical protein
MRGVVLSVSGEDADRSIALASLINVISGLRQVTE